MSGNIHKMNQEPAMALMVEAQATAEADAPMEAIIGRALISTINAAMSHFDGVPSATYLNVSVGFTSTMISSLIEGMVRDGVASKTDKAAIRKALCEKLFEDLTARSETACGKTFTIPRERAPKKDAS